MPPVRREDEEERHDERGQGSVEARLLRRELGAEGRQRGEAAARLPRLAAHREEEGRHARRRESRQEESLLLLGDFADVAQGRESPGGHLRRRYAPRQGAVVLIASDDRNALRCHLARTESSRAWSALVLRIAAPEVTVSDGGDGLAKALGGVARHAPSALRLPRPLAGEVLYDVEAQDAGVRRALRARQGAPGHHRPQGGRRVGAGAPRVVEALGRAPVRDLRRRGPPPQARPREARQGEALAR